MELKIISLNIEGNRHLDLVTDFLQQEAPDIICLQEAFDVHVEQLAEATGMLPFYKPMSNVTFPSVHADPCGYLGIMQLIHPRLSIRKQGAEYYVGSESEIPIFFENENPNSINRVVLWSSISDGSNNFTVATTHFTWSPQGQTTDEQLEDFSQLEAVLDNIQPDVFCGDMNAPRGGEIYRRLSQRFIDNIPNDVTTTIDGSLHKSGKDIQLVVDGMFTVPEVRVQKVSVHKGVSDHCAVVAQLQS